MDQIHRIRDLYYGQDKSITEIARIENLDWRTVRKYVDMEDFNEAPPSPEEERHSSKLDSCCYSLTLSLIELFKLSSFDPKSCHFMVLIYYCKPKYIGLQ